MSVSQCLQLRAALEFSCKAVEEQLRGASEFRRRRRTNPQQTRSRADLDAESDEP